MKIFLKILSKSQHFTEINVELAEFMFKVFFSESCNTTKSILYFQILLNFLWSFVGSLFFGKELLAPRPTTQLEATPCRLSAIEESWNDGRLEKTA
jgi:hypothetical protein